MTGLPYPVRLAGYGIRAPKTRVRGREVAGRVEAVGQAVTTLAVGDEVFGIADGAFAEYASARPDKLVPRPANLAFEQAATVAVSALTALQALRDRAHVAGRAEGAGHRRLGWRRDVRRADRQGVRRRGHRCMQHAKMDLVRSIGADHVIDYTREDIADGRRRYDVILDIGGNRPSGSSAAP